MLPTLHSLHIICWSCWSWKESNHTVPFGCRFSHFQHHIYFCYISFWMVVYVVTFATLPAPIRHISFWKQKKCKIKYNLSSISPSENIKFYWTTHNRYSIRHLIRIRWNSIVSEATFSASKTTSALFIFAFSSLGNIAEVPYVHFPMNLCCFKWSVYITNRRVYLSFI